MTITHQRHEKRLTALFFLLLALIGLITSFDYGLPCDEPAEQVILQENLKEYAYRFFGEGSEAVRYYDSIDVQRISQSIEKDHGQSAYYLAAPILQLSSSAPDLVSDLWHLVTWLWFMLGVVSIYGFCREAGISRIISCAGSLLLYLSPRFFAEGHYNNKDVVLLSLVLASLWLGLRFLMKPCYLRGLLFSFIGAMATNTKVVGAIGWGLIGLCAIVMITARREWSWRMARVAAATIGSFVCFYALLTPALWDDPLQYISYLLLNASGFSRWTGVVIFRGMVFDHAVHPLPRYYLPYMILVTTPIYLPLLAIIGQLSFIGNAAKKKIFAFSDAKTLAYIAATLTWLIPLCFAFLTKPLVYNGWRHFYFVYAGIVLIAAYGMEQLWCWAMERKKPMHTAVAIWLCLCFVITGVGIAVNHPHQYAYYNPLALGDGDMELDYWDVSTNAAIDQLLTAKRNTDLPLLLGARDDMSWFGVEHGYTVLPLDAQSKLSIEFTPDAPYLFYNTTYAQIYGIEPPIGYHELLHISSYGNTLCTLYEID